jgi:hypothetical protein
MSEKYLLYLDILGFGPLANKIAKERRIDPQEIRQKFICVISEKISFLREENKISGVYYDNSDSWIVIMDSYDQVIENISIILDHDTRYEDYRLIPIEFAIGYGKYDKWAKFEGNSFIIENSTIEFIKTNIIKHYHAWFQENFHGEKIVATYILITQSAYNQLDTIDKTIWKKIESFPQLENYFFCANYLDIQAKSKIFSFLDCIEHSGTKRFRRIDETYVEPLEYDEILESLSKKQIVFIIGTQEFGKTFTAVKLLWEYFKEGYHVKWIKGEEQKDREKVRKKLENIENELIPHHVIYFEDPFGITKYEDRKGLEREIGTIIDTINQVPDTFVIITSREEVFKEFEKETVSASRLKKFEQNLNIKRNSYNHKKREQILLKYAYVENCVWLSNEKLKKMVLEFIDDETNLPTPLSLSSFAVSTSKISDRDILIKKIIEKSEETAKAFAKEFLLFSEDKQFFLSFLFISSLPYGSLKQKYNALADEFKFSHWWSFETLLSWFKDDKIDIAYKNEFQHSIAFSHPSYLESLKYLLTENGVQTRFNADIFSKVLLIESKSQNWYVAEVLVNYFPQIPVDIANECLSIVDTSPFVESTIRITIRNYSSLTQKNQDLLDTILNFDDEMHNRTLAEEITNNYDELPKKVQEIIIHLAKRKECHFIISQFIVKKYNSLPDSIKQLLKEIIIQNDRMAASIAYMIVNNFENQDYELQQIYNQFLKNDKFLRGLAFSISFEGLENCPKKIFYDILENMEGCEDTYPQLAFLVERSFDIIEESYRNKLIKKLSKDEKCVNQIAITILTHFNFLPLDIQNLIFEILNIDDTNNNIANELLSNFEKFPKEYREKIIRRMAHNPRYIKIITHLITKYYSILSDDIQHILIEYSENEEYSIVIPEAVMKYYEKLPSKITNLIEKLSENPKSFAYVNAAIVQRYPILPQKSELKLRHILHRNLKTEESLKVLLPELIINYENLPLDLKYFPRFYCPDVHYIPIVSKTFINNYSVLHPDMKNLFWNICYFPDIAEIIIPDLIKRFDLDEEELIALLKYYAENKETSFQVAYAICIDSWYVNSLLKEIFLKIINDPDVLEKLCSILENEPELFYDTDDGIIQILTEKRHNKAILT